MKEKSTETGAVWKKSRQWYWLPSIIFSVGIVSIILLLLVNHLSERDHLDSLLIDAIMDIEINASSVHFRIEEAADRNAEVDVNEVMGAMDEAIKLSDSIINGGETEHGRLTEPLTDPNFLAHAEGLRQSLTKYKMSVVKRLRNYGKSGFDLVADRQRKVILSELNRKAEELDDLIGKNKVKEWEKNRRLHVWILFIWLSIIATTTASFWVYEKRREKASAELRESEEQFRMLFDLAVDGIFILDMQGHFLDVNRTAYERLGYTKEEILSLNIMELDPPEFAVHVPKRLEQIQQQDHAIFESAHYRKDKSIMPVEINSRAMEYKGQKVFFSVIRDITERKVLEKELTLQKQMLEDITQGITESIMLLSKDFKILWANKAALRQTGLSLEELMESHCYEATHRRERPCEASGYPCPVIELIKTGVPSVKEHMHYAANGDKMFVEVSAYPVRDESGEIVSFIHISKDITERKRKEEERERLMLELQQSIAKVKTLSGLLPICASCKKIKDDQGYWSQIEAYIRDHSEAEFTHGVCPECAKKLYPEYYDKVWGREDKESSA